MSLINFSEIDLSKKVQEVNEWLIQCTTEDPVVIKTTNMITNYVAYYVQQTIDNVVSWQQIDKKTALFLADPAVNKNPETFQDFMQNAKIYNQPTLKEYLENATDLLDGNYK